MNASVFVPWCHIVEAEDVEISKKKKKRRRKERKEKSHSNCLSSELT